MLLHNLSFLSLAPPLQWGRVCYSFIIQIDANDGPDVAFYGNGPSLKNVAPQGVIFKPCTTPTMGSSIKFLLTTQTVVNDDPDVTFYGNGPSLKNVASQFIIFKPCTTPTMGQFLLFIYNPN
ncbi:MAG: hypothetical protein DWP94_14515 [Flavobacterium sp.]|nr:MAG: hypothetical protein DWP94_14515 [Flavobacterium sp.]